jgi:hypothetical protein
MAGVVQSITMAFHANCGIPTLTLHGRIEDFDAGGNTRNAAQDRQMDKRRPYEDKLWCAFNINILCML